jgi:hypothetical protein
MKKKKDILTSTIPKKTLDANKLAIEIYQAYRSIRDMINKIDAVFGRSSSYNTSAKSTINFEINYNGVGSTTKQRATS